MLVEGGLTGVDMQKYYLSTGEPSYNVIAKVEGRDPDKVVVIGGHYDSRQTTPGANDNASGAACVVELARVFHYNGGAYPTLVFICFGGEEDPGKETSHVNCHLGSRHYVQALSQAQKSQIIGMISLDMVGFGDILYARYMGIGPMRLVDMFTARGIRSKKGGNLSDHEPFEKAGIPSVWLEHIPDGYDYDPEVHKMSDNYGHVRRSCVEGTGRLVQDFLESLDEESYRSLLEAKKP
jgi:Zn-dependent M28 family amino/carboxypeptidase